MFHWPKIFDRKDAPVSNLSDPARWLADLFEASPTAAGRGVTPNTAMRVPAVACAVAQISDAVATLPCFVYQRGAGGERDRAPEHPAYRLVHDDANEWTSAGQLRRQLVIDALLSDHGIAYVGRAEGRPIELTRLDPGSIEVGIDGSSGEPVFILRERSGGKRILPRRDVLYVPAISVDGVRGVAPIKLAREAIALAAILEEYGARLFAGGARPSGLLATDSKLNELGINNVRKIFESAHAGPGNSGRMMILPEGFRFTPMALTSVDAQFLELRQFQISEIARAFKIPPVFIMDYGRATWGNSEEMNRQFLTYTLMPWLEALQAAYRRCLIDPEDRDEFYIEFDTAAFLKADTQARAQAYATLIAARVLNPNEARRREGLPDYAGGEVFANPNTTPGPAGGVE